MPSRMRTSRQGGATGRLLLHPEARAAHCPPAARSCPRDRHSPPAESRPSPERLRQLPGVAQSRGAHSAPCAASPPLGVPQDQPYGPRGGGGRSRLRARRSASVAGRLLGCARWLCSWPEPVPASSLSFPLLLGSASQDQARVTESLTGAAPARVLLGGRREGRGCRSVCPPRGPMRGLTAQRRPAPWVLARPRLAPALRGLGAGQVLRGRPGDVEGGSLGSEPRYPTPDPPPLSPRGRRGAGR